MKYVSVKIKSKRLGHKVIIKVGKEKTTLPALYSTEYGAKAAALEALLELATNKVGQKVALKKAQ